MLSLIAEKSLPFLYFYLFLVISFAAVMHSLGITFDGTSVDSETPWGEYTGINFFPLVFILYTLRQSLGDFKVDCFNFLPKPVMYFTWFFWVILIIMCSLIFLNFLISVITECYDEVREFKIEEAY